MRTNPGSPALTGEMPEGGILMRLSNRIVPAALLLLLLGGGDSSAEVEPTALTASYKAPIVASLGGSASHEPSSVRRASRSPQGAVSTGGADRRAALSSPGGQLAITAGVFVFALLLASLASKRS